MVIISSNYNFDNFLNIDGIGETQINSLKKFFSNKTNAEVIKKLSKFINIIKDDINLDGKLNNKTFMITGKLSGVSRAEVKSLIENVKFTNLDTIVTSRCQQVSFCGKSLAELSIRCLEQSPCSAIYLAD